MISPEAFGAEVRALAAELSVEWVRESFAPPARAGSNVGIGGKRGAALDGLLDASIRYGTDALNKLAGRAVTRLLNAGAIHAQRTARLFTDDELAEFAEALAAINGTADQLARALLRDYLALMERRHSPSRQESVSTSLLREDLTNPLSLLAPEEAVAYFRGLVPTLGTDPDIFGNTMRRRAFTLAVATDTELLARVQGALAQALEAGDLGTGKKAVQSLLDAAGVSPKNPQYAEMVVRTNVIDSYNQAADEERMSPDVIDAFPVWQYSNPNDERSRPDHAAKDGKYYPASASFIQVRGADIADAANCRCTFIPVYRADWASLQASGARVETSW